MERSLDAPPFAAGELPPRKVAWLHPWQLARTAYNAWLSSVAAEYLDRRETLAALDRIRVPKRVPTNWVVQPGETIDAYLNVPEKGVWIDYVSDIGDCWEATYAVLKLLVTPKLRVRGHDVRLNPAHIVTLGGDLVYPTPSRERYRQRTRSALVAVRPKPHANPPGLFTIPGNHDWYDGLTNFVREFCQGRFIGGWSLFQRRSYFAVKLTRHWWLWGIDIALDTRIDIPQQSYFLEVLRSKGASDAEKFEHGDNIILCTAKPAWTDVEEGSDAYRNLSYFVQEIIEGNDGHQGRVRVILAGDAHHYSRYTNKRGDHLITAGGGGAYLTGTHHLPNTVPDLRAPANESGLAGEGAGDQPKPRNAYHIAGFPYPSRTTSRRLALRTAFLALRPANLPFVLFVGLVYLLLAWTLRQGDPELFVAQNQEFVARLLEVTLEPAATAVFVISLAVLVAGVIVPIAAEPSARRWLTIPWGLAHGLAHLILAVWLARQINQWPMLETWAAALPYERGNTVTVFSLMLVLLGGLAGSTLVGVYFVLSDLIFKWHTNEVFAAQSIVDYRNFLRMHLAPSGQLTIYPVGLRKVPLKWRLRLDRKPEDPFYEPTDYVLEPHLIEGPIEITPR